MIKYAVLTPSLAQPGGAERTILIQLRYGDPRRMRCTGIALSGYGAMDLDLARDICQYTTIHGDTPRGHWQRPKSSLVQTTYRNLADAVTHVCKEADALITWGGLALGGFTAGLPIPVVCVSHCSDITENRITGITHLVAVSKVAYTFFSGARNAAGFPVHVIPNGVEIDRVCPRRGRAWQRAQWGVGGDDKVLLYLGRQAPDKNPWACIQALAKLGPEYRLIMIGNQSYIPEAPMPRLVELVGRLELEDRVTFLPPIPFVGDVLAGADCLLHLSLREADSLVVKEAFLAGLPVVHTRVGAIPEMEAEYGQVGWGVGLRADVPLGVDSVDPDEAVEAIRQALAPGAKAITAKMRAAAWDRWTGPAMCERWADYLEMVVGGWKWPPDRED